MQAELCLHSPKPILFERNDALSCRKLFSALLLFPFCSLLQGEQNIFNRLVKQTGTINLAFKYTDKGISLEKAVVGFLAGRLQAKQRTEFESEL